jgi:hypothetical protein
LNFIVALQTSIPLHCMQKTCLQTSQQAAVENGQIQSSSQRQPNKHAEMLKAHAVKPLSSHLIIAAIYHTHLYQMACNACHCRIVSDWNWHEVMSIWSASSQLSRQEQNH